MAATGSADTSRHSASNVQPLTRRWSPTTTLKCTTRKRCAIGRRTKEPKSDLMMALNDALNGRIDHLLARARLAAIFRISLPYFVAGGNTVVDHGGCATSDPRGVGSGNPISSDQIRTLHPLAKCLPGILRGGSVGAAHTGKSLCSPFLLLCPFDGSPGAIGFFDRPDRSGRFRFPDG